MGLISLRINPSWQRAHMFHLEYLKKQAKYEKGVEASIFMTFQTNQTTLFVSKKGCQCQSMSINSKNMP